MRGEPSLTDYGPEPWLKECLDGAREMLTWTKEHSPAHEEEVVAEIQFWRAALQFIATGAAAPADRTTPPTVIFESLRRAVDHSLERYQESLDSDRAPESAKVMLSPLRAEWERLRDFVDSY
jgi:hypothetical protein